VFPFPILPQAEQIRVPLSLFAAGKKSALIRPIRVIRIPISLLPQAEQIRVPLSLLP